MFVVFYVLKTKRRKNAFFPSSGFYSFLFVGFKLIFIFLEKRISKNTRSICSFVLDNIMLNGCNFSSFFFVSSRKRLRDWAFAEYHRAVCRLRSVLLTRKHFSPCSINLQFHWLGFQIKINSNAETQPLC